MKIRIITTIQQNYKYVFNKFNRELFEFLQPRFPKMKLISFEAPVTGNKVEIDFIFPIKAKWISIITKDEINDTEAYFIDEGETLPPGITYWKHQHIVKKTGENSCEIIDDIEYKSSNKLIELLMYPQLFSSFYPRKKAYKKFFNSN